LYYRLGAELLINNETVNVFCSAEQPDQLFTNTIKGKVRWSYGDNPVAGLRIRLINAQGTVLQTSSQANGDYRFDSLPVGYYSLFIDAQPVVNLFN